MHHPLIKRLDFPEFHRTLLGINDQPICELDDARLAADIAAGLQAALPGSEIAHGTLEKSDIIGLLGFSPEAAASNGTGCYPNETEIDDAWDRWFDHTSEAELFALYDLKYGAMSDPFYVNDCPQPGNTASAYFHNYLAGEMTAQELDQALQQHPEVMLTATILEEDMLSTLEGLGYQGNEDNLAKAQTELELFFGKGNELRTSIYNLLLQRFDELSLNRSKEKAQTHCQ